MAEPKVEGVQRPASSVQRPDSSTFFPRPLLFWLSLDWEEIGSCPGGPRNVRWDAARDWDGLQTRRTGGAMPDVAAGQGKRFTGCST